MVPGNHDGNISRLVPDTVSISSQSGVIIDGVLLTHGHAMPSEKFSSAGNIVMGHVHPTYSSGDSVLNGKAVWVYLQANKNSIFPSSTGTTGITVMPSFNEHLYGGRKKAHHSITSPILKRALEGLLSAKIISTDGAILGDESYMVCLFSRPYRCSLNDGITVMPVVFSCTCTRWKDTILVCLQIHPYCFAI